MENTRATLLVKIKDSGNAQAWTEFHQLYAPLLYGYASARGLSHEDAEEVRDQCLEIVVRKIPTFEYDKESGGFRSWLYRMANSRVADLLRRRAVRVAGKVDIKSLVDPSPTPDELWERNWKDEHLRFCVEQVRDSVPEEKYRVFCMLLYEDCSAGEVCDRLGMNRNQVYKAKAGVLQQVRNKLAELGSDLV